MGYMPTGWKSSVPGELRVEVGESGVDSDPG